MEACVVANAVNAVLAGLTLTEWVKIDVVDKVLLLPLLLLLLLLVLVTKNAGMNIGEWNKRDVHQCVTHVMNAIMLCGIE